MVFVFGIIFESNKEVRGEGARLLNLRIALRNPTAHDFAPLIRIALRNPTAHDFAPLTGAHLHHTTYKMMAFSKRFGLGEADHGFSLGNDYLDLIIFSVKLECNDYLSIAE